MWLILVPMTCITILISMGYYFVRRRYAFFRDRGILHESPIFPFGSMSGIGKKYHHLEITKRIYDKFYGKDVVAGLFSFFEPCYIALDTNFIKNILMRDFTSFHDHGIYYNEKQDPLSANLFVLEGERWKYLRAKLSPIFTSGKIKMLFDVIVNCAQAMEHYLDQMIVAGKNEIEAYDLVALYATDVIGTCAFGIESNSFRNPNAIFSRMAQKMFTVTILSQMKFLLVSFAPSVANLIGVRAFESDVTQFFATIIRETINYRQRNNFRCKDILQLLLDVEIENEKLTLNEIAAQCLLFFLAGYQTTSTTMSFALYELSKRQDIQDRVRAEIEMVVAKNCDTINYDCLQEMSYLDQVINETLRLYPPIDSLTRKTTMEYIVPDSKHVIEKDMLVIIPVYAIHRNPNIYEEPEKFDPDRFSSKNKQNQSLYLPFGDGPRNCIGYRFGMLKIRLGLIHILRKYRVLKSLRTVETVRMSPSATMTAAKNGNWLVFEKL